MKPRLQLYTDFVCPFCFIAEEGLVPRLLSEFDLELDWRGFELHPSTPTGGRPLSVLFPGTDLESLHDRTIAFAAAFDVVGFRPPNWLSNTRKILAASEYAREQGQLEVFRREAFNANFRQGRDLETRETLLHLAEASALPPAPLLAASQDPSYLDRVDEKQSEARNLGVSAIPTFVLNDKKLVGCQPYARLAQFVRTSLPAAQ